MFLIAEEASVMLQGVGTRLDFHLCKTIADLRYVRQRSSEFTLMKDQDARDI